MPYKSTSELPKQCDGLPDAAKKIFMSAFNAAYDEYGEERAMAIAWSAVKNKYKKEGDKWVAKDAAERAQTDCVFIERMEMDFTDAAQVRTTRDGYLVCQPRVARTGIQIYKGYEVGVPEMDQVRVYRPEEEVFSPDAVRSFAHVPITNDHPPEFVTADNWGKYSKGQSGGDEVVRDGDFIRVPMMLMDGATIKDTQKGKKQLSAGYAARLVWGAGTSPKGEAYDAKQVQIRCNHIAVCDKARGGPMLCLGDSFTPPIKESHSPKPRDQQQGRVKMARSLTVDSISVAFDDDQAASIVQRALADRDTRITTITADVTRLNTDIAARDKEIGELKATLSTKDGEIKALGVKIEDAKMKPEQVDKLVSERTDLLGRAHFILGDSFDPKGKTNIEIMRAVVGHKMGDAAKTMGDGELGGAFKVLTSDYKPSEHGDNGVQQLSRAFSFPVHQPGSAAKAYNDRNADLRDAWKPQETKRAAS